MFNRLREIKSGYRIAITDDGCFGYIGSFEIYLPTPKCELDMDKCLKKAWKHFCKLSAPTDNVSAEKWNDTYQYWETMHIDWYHETWEHEFEKGVNDTPFF